MADEQLFSLKALHLERSFIYIDERQAGTLEVAKWANKLHFSVETLLGLENDRELELHRLNVEALQEHLFPVRLQILLVPSLVGDGEKFDVVVFGALGLICQDHASVDFFILKLLTKHIRMLLALHLPFLLIVFDVSDFGVTRASSFQLCQRLLRLRIYVQPVEKVFIVLFNSP